MTKVDFYILPEPEARARQQFACRLVEKVFRMGQDVCVLADDEAACRSFDALLWAYNPTSFIPHSACVNGQQPGAAEKVWVTHGDNFHHHHHLLINLSCKQPPHFSRFERLAEIVVQQDEVLNNSRQRYRFYQERGYPIRNHDMRR
ncbi:MAG: DNA polymerase III subunit chi [Cellvibrionaceae bacterium]|nr:DNA polymerase III subunit chi [Cellvibrionaceae bacterium]